MVSQKIINLEKEIEEELELKMKKRAAETAQIHTNFKFYELKENGFTYDTMPKKKYMIMMSSFRRHGLKKKNKTAASRRAYMRIWRAAHPGYTRDRQRAFRARQRLKGIKV